MRIKSILKTCIPILLLTGVLSSCKPAIENEKHMRIAKHVILIGSDGFGAYAFENAKIPAIREMMANGAYSLEARAVLPTSSAVNWASMLMGSGPELHGYTEWGSKVPELPSKIIGKGGIYPTLFSLIDEQLPEEKKGASYTWGGIKYLFERTMADLDINGKTDEETAEKAIDFIIHEKPAFTFIHFDEPDHAGHSIGHDTPEYYEQVERIDGLVSKIINRLKESGMMDDTIVIFSSDHGGINKGHGGKTLLEIQIPWIIYGKGVVAKGKLETSIVTYDTAATIAYILGLEQPQSWIGRPVLSVFENSNKNN